MQMPFYQCKFSPIPTIPPVQVRNLAAEAERLSEIHGSEGDQIRNKQADIESEWAKLREKAANRKARLDDSYNLHRFLSDYRDLISWISDTKTIISADELAKDVAGAEALLERHQEHKVGFGGV
jgi:spectrin alpha